MARAAERRTMASKAMHRAFFAGASPTGATGSSANMSASTLSANMSSPSPPAAAGPHPASDIAHHQKYWETQHRPWAPPQGVDQPTQMASEQTQHELRDLTGLCGHLQKTVEETKAEGCVTLAWKLSVKMTWRCSGLQLLHSSTSSSADNAKIPAGIVPVTLITPVIPVPLLFPVPSRPICAVNPYTVVRVAPCNRAASGIRSGIWLGITLRVTI
ncbi:MAG: hypothetical protein FRX49_11532 [Trebouxia sp. A1-2]|nr:MAG: hypothetical protein FRX49_11532 [Trebouxia sp. A1-2]